VCHGRSAELGPGNRDQRATMETEKAKGVAILVIATVILATLAAM
jgi:hypothetical protein